MGIAPPTWLLCPTPPIGGGGGTLPRPSPPSTRSYLSSGMHPPSSGMHPQQLDFTSHPAHCPCFFLTIFFLHHTALGQDYVAYDHLWRQGLERMMKVNEAMTVGKL